MLTSRQRFFILASLTVFAAACAKKAPPPRGPAEVGFVTLQAKAVKLTTELPGRVNPFRMADVRPQATGILKKRLFTEGGDVVAGEALYQIDDGPYQASYDSALATVQRDSAAVTSTTLLLNRYKPLVAANAVSKQDYDNAVASQLEAAADMSSAQAALESAQINLVYTRVLSPISGRIGRSSMTEGALVTANQTNALATVQQLDPIYVDVTQPSALLLRLQRELSEGRLRSAGANQALVRLTLEDGTPYSHPGKLQFSEVTVDPGTDSVTIRAIFPNPDHMLLPGMFVRERIQEGIQENGVLVPQIAVTHDTKGEPVAMVVGADNKVELRSLKTDRAIGDQWLVSDGVKAGDRVIVEGLQKIAPGAEVHGVEVSTAAAPSSAGAPPAPAH